MIITRSNGATTATVHGRHRFNRRSNPNRERPSIVRPSGLGQCPSVGDLRAASNVAVARAEIVQNVGACTLEKPEDEAPFKFIPYKSAHPNISKVKLKAYDGKAFIRDLEFDSSLIPNPEIISRDEILLESTREKENRLRTVKAARALAKQIKADVQGGKLSYIPPDSSYTTLENFKKALYHAGRKLGISSVNRNDVLALTAYYCLKTDVDDLRGQDGIFTRIPTGLYNPQSDAAVSIITTLFKHYLLDLRRDLDIKYASKIEEISDWDKIIDGSGLSYLKKSISITNILKIMFPGYLEGGNSPIREWLVKAKNKWQGDDGKDLATRACKNFFKYCTNVIGEDGSINLDELFNIDLKGELFSSKYGLEGMMKECPYTRTFEDVVELAFPGLLGFRENQIPNWKMDRSSAFSEANRKKTIDSITDDLAREHNLIGKNNSETANNIRKISNWATLYEEKRHHCLWNSGMKTAYNALKHRYPQLFGHGKDQIKLWEIRFENMWDVERGGKELFKQAFAYALYLDGLGEMDLNREQPFYTFTVGQFEKWYKEKVSGDKGLRDHLGAHLTNLKLGGGFGIVAGSSLIQAFAILFENEDGTITSQKSFRNNYVLKLLEASKGQCSVVFKTLEPRNNISKTDIELIKEAKRGNTDAERVLVERYLEFIQSRARVLSRRYRIDEDSLISDVCLKIHRYLIPGFDEKKQQSFKPLLASAIETASMNLVSARKSSHVEASLNAPTCGEDNELGNMFEAPNEGGDSRVDAIDTVEFLRARLQIDPKHQIVIERLFGVDFGTNPKREELTPKEISRRYKINERTVSYIKCARLQTMKTLLQRSA